MKSGRPLDVLIAEKVFEYTQITPSHSERGQVFFGYPKGKTKSSQIPQYSTDISSAWKIVQMFKDRNFSLLNDAGQSGAKETPRRGWMALFHIEGGPMGYSFGDSAAHAICIAILRALKHID